MKFYRYLLLHILFVCVSIAGRTQTSIPRVWVNELLNAIRNDRARPPVHARNLHHISLGMYDAWAAYQSEANTIFLGKNMGEYFCPFDGVILPPSSEEIVLAQETAISYFAYRLIRHRFVNSPGAFVTFESIEQTMTVLGYDPEFTSNNYVEDGPAALGNYLAEKVIEFGFADGSNEQGDFSYQYYFPVNPPIEPELPGNPTMINPNRWQEISLSVAIDQSGNTVIGTPPFVGPEWGNVVPFAMDPDQAVELVRDNSVYKVYHLPESPPYLDTNTQTGLEDFFKWNFLMVSIWQSHLDPNDTTFWDISPASIGNIQTYPEDWLEYSEFYDLFEGGDNGQGYAGNPITGLPYQPQIVKRGDYARVLAEFWADGLDSETPPGHWFEIYHEVSEHPLFEWKWKGQGDELSHLEYDVKAYLSLGGAMHDAAISAWSVKGWFDYPRPVSAIRYMAGLGQSTDPMGVNYHPGGLPLVPGFVELVSVGDSLEGVSGEHVGKVKLYTWKGHEYVFDPDTDVAGVGWILAENWWPYQRPSFVSPPFAGYVSGHSTYSRAAAEVLTFITGSEYFPGGMSGFIAEVNEFLHFEVGPSETIALQWAKYRDASDQCSLSRIWGGIHPPIDDIPGRKIGEQVGVDASFFSDSVISAQIPLLTVQPSLDSVKYQNIGELFTLQVNYSLPMQTIIHPDVTFPNTLITELGLAPIDSTWVDEFTYLKTFQIDSQPAQYDQIYVSIKNGITSFGNVQMSQLFMPLFEFDTQNPAVSNVESNFSVINSNFNDDYLIIDWYFSEPCSENVPQFSIQSDVLEEVGIVFNIQNSSWLSSNHFRSFFVLSNSADNVGVINIEITEVFDLFGNSLLQADNNNFTVQINSQLPSLLSVTSSNDELTIFDQGGNILSIQLEFDKAMNLGFIPNVYFNSLFASSDPFSLSNQSEWLNDSILMLYFNNYSSTFCDGDVFDLVIEEISDAYGNSVTQMSSGSIVYLDNVRPVINSLTPSLEYVDFTSIMENQFHIDIAFSEEMFTGSFPQIEVLMDGIGFEDIVYEPFNSYWLDEQIFRAQFSFNWSAEETVSIDLKVLSAMDIVYNPQHSLISNDVFEYNGTNLVGYTSMNDDPIVHLFPSPLRQDELLHFKTDFHEGFEVKIQDLMGRELENFLFHESSGSFKMSNYRKGQYLILITSGTKQIVQKIMIYE
jgi:hypothetical protein